MQLVITGTPGTGKTTVSEKLEPVLGWEVYHLTDVLRSNDIGVNKDGEREVSPANLTLDNMGLPADQDWILEGHLAHHLPADICVVLRCHPSELEKRLEGRGYSAEKVKDNLESEAVDVILTEAVEKQQKVIEIDTSGKSVEEVTEEVRKKVERGEEDFGNIDFSSWL